MQHRSQRPSTAVCLLQSVSECLLLKRIIGDDETEILCAEHQGEPGVWVASVEKQPALIVTLAYVFLQSVLECANHLEDSLGLLHVDA